MISFQTNIDSLIAQQNLNINSKFQSNTIQQLTSGYRINSSGDDAAGLSVANQDRNQIAQITQGVANGNNGTAQLQIMDGGMSNISQILDRLQTLAVQSASSSFTGSRTDLNAEFQSDITELNRQAQAIGLNTGGTFASIMDVYLGGGGGANTGAVTQNAQVTVDLSKSTVDAHSLGLAGMGMQVVAGTTDISSNSATHSAYQILSNQANKDSLTGGDSIFYLSGPGFSDGSKAKLSVDLSNVNDINTLVTAVNNAITAASTGSSTPEVALKNAGISAAVHTDAGGGQELSFSSNSTAFQVEAGDQMANALMGNLDPTTPALGVAVHSTVKGANPTSGSFSAESASGVYLQISGAGLAKPEIIQVTGTTVGNAATSGTAIYSLVSQVNGDTNLQKAGITVAQSSDAGNPLVFTSATGESFSVQATGDTSNLLGLGSLDVNSTAASPSFYSTITGNTYSATSNGNGLATLGFSLNGGSTDGGAPVSGEKAATITGVAPAGILTGGKLDTSGYTTASSLMLSVNNTAVSVDFSKDANQGATEKLTDIAKFINNTVNTAMGWGSDVQLATVSGSDLTSALTLTDPYADSASTLSVSGTPAAALGFTGATTATGTDAVGNTVTLNLAGGNATQATYASTATAAALANGIDTSHASSVVYFNVDGTNVKADFAQDTTLVNGVAANLGTAAVLTGASLGADGNATVNVSSLQAQAAKLSGNALGSAATIDTSKLLAQAAIYKGNGIMDTGAWFTTAGPGSDALHINGTEVDFTNNPATNLTTVAYAINHTAGLSSTVQASVVAGLNGTSKLQIASIATGSGASVSITDNADSEALGLAVAGQTSPSTASGADASALSVQFDTGTVYAVQLGNSNTAMSLADVAIAINNSLDSQIQAGPINYAKVDSTTGTLSITGTTTGLSKTVTVQDSTAAEALGFTTNTQSAVATGSDAQKLQVNVDGVGNKVVDFSSFGTSGSGSLQSLADYINGSLDDVGTGYGTAVNYVTVGTGANAGALVFTGVKTGGTTAQGGGGSVSIINDTTHTAAAQLLGLATGGGHNNLVNGQNESVADVVSFLNSAAQKALGTRNDSQATIFSVDANGTISMNSQTHGAKSQVGIGTGTADTGILTALGLTTSANTVLASGQNADANSLATTLSNDFLNNSNLHAAGLVASAATGALQITSSNNTSFRLGEYGTTGSILGFVSTGSAFSASLTSTASQATLLDAGGTSALGTGTAANPYLTFKPMLYGGDTQAITISANNSAGVPQPLTITLHNDTVNGQSGASIDSAVAYINSQIQAFKNPTLQNIVAVKEKNSDGTEGINFLSSLSSFNVSVGSSVNGNGLNGGLAQTFGSMSNGAANNSAVDTLAGAQAAVTAVTAAVQSLGSAQATVGKGQNQLSYAVNLAQSQITNISAAQSQIRDANVAQEAANMTKAQVLQQATIAAMAQANQEPQAVLSLLKQ